MAYPDQIEINHLANEVGMRKQMNPTSLWHPYWLNSSHDWFCRLVILKRTKANKISKLFCVSYSLFTWVRRIEIGKCHLLICLGGNSWRRIFWTLTITIISINRNYIHSGYLAFGDSDYPCTFYLYQHFPHLFIINISLRICLPC